MAPPLEPGQGALATPRHLWPFSTIVVKIPFAHEKGQL